MVESRGKRGQLCGCNRQLERRFTLGVRIFQCMADERRNRSKNLNENSELAVTYKATPTDFRWG